MTCRTAIRQRMFHKTVAVEMTNFNDDDWRDRPLAGTGFLIACVLGLVIYVLAAWAWVS